MKQSYKNDNVKLKYLNDISNQVFVAQKIIDSKVKSVLDIGCYSGTLLGALLSLGWSGDYTGVDISEDMIGKSKALYPNHNFVLGSAQNLQSDLKSEMIILGGVFVYLTEEESKNTLSDIQKKTGAKTLLFHDIIRCTNKVYKNPNVSGLLERGNYTIVAGKNSERKYIQITI